MNKVHRLEYDSEAGPDAFTKEAMLIYPRLGVLDRLEIVTGPEPAEPRQLARFLATVSCNVISIEHADEPPQSKLRKTTNADGHATMLSATEAWLRKYGISDPFETGFIFPAELPICFETDLGVTPQRLGELQREAYHWEFDSNQYTADELLAIQFVLIKELIEHKDLSPSLKLSDSRLLWALAVCRMMYKPVVQYHSYKHCSDVLQCIVMLIRVYEDDIELTPSQRLALALAGIGHDMLHPGFSVQLVKSVDPKFSERWPNLERYHSDLFRKVLDQVWPEIAEHWAYIVDEAIEATELAQHYRYVRPTAPPSVPPFRLSFAHAIKISDFASCMRKHDSIYFRNSIAIFAEFMTERRLSTRMVSRPEHRNFQEARLTRRELISHFVAAQQFFMTKFACPYFAWLTEHDEHFEPQSEFCTHILDRIEKFEDDDDIPKDLGDLLEEDYSVYTFMLSKYPT